VAYYIATGPFPEEIILIDPRRAMVQRILRVDGPGLGTDTADVALLGLVLDYGHGSALHGSGPGANQAGVTAAYNNVIGPNLRNKTLVDGIWFVSPRFCGSLILSC
jgi:hypothetical protein